MPRPSRSLEAKAESQGRAQDRAEGRSEGRGQSCGHGRAESRREVGRQGSAALSRSQARRSTPVRLARRPDGAHAPLCPDRANRFARSWSGPCRSKPARCRPRRSLAADAPPDSSPDRARPAGPVPPQVAAARAAQGRTSQDRSAQDRNTPRPKPKLEGCRSRRRSRRNQPRPAQPCRRASGPRTPTPAATRTPRRPGIASPSLRSGWMIQVGAFQAEQEAKQRLSAIQSEGFEGRRRYRSVYRIGGERWQHVLPRTLRRVRQGQGGSRVQGAQA